jgi:hypothetical protein
MTRDQKVQRWTEREARRSLHTMIIDDEKGGYVAFGRYQLKPTLHQVEVTVNNDSSVSVFSNKRTAISWCVADNYKQYGLAKIIKTLDHKKQALSADINYNKQVAHKGKNHEFQELVITKLESKVGHYSLVDRELEKCLNLAKYIQLKGFQNETARTSGR